MLKLAANLTMMFTEFDFLDRFDVAAENGFKAVEYLFPYQYPPITIAKALERSGLEQALFNFPPGEWDNGDRGLAAVEGREGEFLDSIKKGLEYAEATAVRQLHLMAGIASGKSAADTYSRRIEYAGEAVKAKHINLLIEPINNRDMPGYFMNSFDLAAAMIANARYSNLKLQFDVYHRQILAGDVIRGIEKHFPIIGHVQIASVPLRNEPGSGELNDGMVLACLDMLGYQGFVGCEYRPARTTVEGLSWRNALKWR